MKASGNCFEVVGKVAMGISDIEDARVLALVLNKVLIKEDDRHVVHGTVTRPSDNLMHEHAWIEVTLSENDIVVFDFGNGLRFVGNREHYYSLGEIENPKRYSYKQAIVNMAKTGHFGPWTDDEV